MADRLPAYPTPQEAFSNPPRRKSPTKPHGWLGAPPAPSSNYQPGPSQTYHSGQPQYQSGQPQYQSNHPSYQSGQPQYQSGQPQPYHQAPPHQTQQPYEYRTQPSSAARPQPNYPNPSHQGQGGGQYQHHTQAPAQPQSQGYAHGLPVPLKVYQREQYSDGREHAREPTRDRRPPMPISTHSDPHIQNRERDATRVTSAPAPIPSTSRSNTSVSTGKLGMEAQLKEMFARYDIHRNGLLNEDELSNALVNFDRSKFRISTIKLMMRSFDANGTGSLEFSEFYRLWNYLQSYSKLFQEADADRSFTILFGEYQGIVKKIGYDLPTDTVLFIFSKFSGIADGGIPSLKFDAFIESLFYLRKITDTFRKYDKESQGIALIKFQDFIVEVLSLK